MNNHKKFRISSSKKNFWTLSREASLVLHIGLPIMIFYLLFFLFTLLSLTKSHGYLVPKAHYYTLEHILMSITLLIIGALSIDLAKKSEK